MPVSDASLDNGILESCSLGVPMMTEWLLTFTPTQDYTYPGHIMAEESTAARRSRRCALYSAAEHGKSKHVAMLLMLGKNPDHRDSFGITPLQIAAWNNHCKVVQKLSKHSADVNIADKVGHTALFKAVWKNCAKCVHCLLRAGAILDARDYSGNTPVSLACELGFVGILTLLLAAGARTSSQNLRGETPLHVAASLGHVACVRLLLDHGANPDSRNKLGSSALSLVAGARWSPTTAGILKLLLQKNCSLEYKSRTPSTKGYSLTCLETAVVRCNVKLARLLYTVGGDCIRLARWDAMHMDLLAGCEVAMEVLRELVASPRSLKDICRIRIRHEVRGRCEPRALPLPPLLLDFLDFKDVFNNDEDFMTVWIRDSQSLHL